MSERPCVVLCVGKDRRKRDEYKPLRAAVAAVADVVPVGCLELCDSPVAVVDPCSDQPLVFDKLRSPRQHRDLAALVAGRAGGAEPTERLSARLVTGKPRRTALAELVKRSKRNPRRP